MCLRTCLQWTPRQSSSAGAAAAPFGFAPTGFTRMMHTDGEPAVARVAERAGIPYALSTMGTTSIESLAAAAPDGAAVVPALPVARPRGEPRLRGPGRGRRLRGARAHRRHPGPRATAARRPQRPDHPAVPVAEDFRGGRVAPRVVVRPPHHRAARVRLAQALRGHPRRARQPPVRPGRVDRRSRLAPLHLGRAADRQGHPQRSRRQDRRRRRSGCRRRVEPRRTTARPGPDALGGAALSGRRGGRPGRGLRRRRCDVGRRRRRCGTIADLAGSAPSGTDRSWSRASSTRPMPGPSSTPERTPSSCRTTGDDSSTGPPPRWRRCPPWSTRWATGPRCTSTEASCRAATSSPPSRWGRGLPWWDALTSTG